MAFTPLNDLDRAIMAAIRSQAAMPDLFRQLIEGELWFLMGYHPEIEGEMMELKAGMPLPFVQLQDANGPVVPIFSSAERVEEGLEKGHVPPRTYSAGAMDARQVLEILGGVGLRAVLNKSCATGEITLSPELLRDLGNGTALKPRPLDNDDEPRTGTLQHIDPADFPTALVQRLFELFRRHREFRAAWIFGVPGGEKLPTGGRHYQILVLMDPRDDAVFHDLRLVAGTSPKNIDIVELGLLDETDAPYVKRMFKRVQPFYVAVD